MSDSASSWGYTGIVGPTVILADESKKTYFLRIFDMSVRFAFLDRFSPS